MKVDAAETAISYSVCLLPIYQSSLSVINTLPSRLIVPIRRFPFPIVLGTISNRRGLY